MSAEFIRVTARVRPSMIAHERIVSVSNDRTLRFDSYNPKNFAFDSVFGEEVTQDQVFEELGSRIVDSCVDGYNGTIFAYGQTGSGKTHTMFGPSTVENFLFDHQQRGLMPRVCEALFRKLCTRAAERGDNFTYEVSCRFVELYNEEFYDLLSPSQQKLSIRSDAKSVKLLGVSEHRAQSSIDMMRVLEFGWDARRTAETAMNRESSRSHAFFIVDVKTEELVGTIVNRKCATLNLVDLAGSERQRQVRVFGDRFKEAVNINLSLTVLGRVIRTLSEASRRGEHVPYRESKLTHILRDSLGGNSRTAVIVNIHPDKVYYSDTLSTLQFAAACRKIENRVCANEDLTGDTIMAYKSEIARLREELRITEGKTRSELWSKMSAIEDELKNWKEMAISREKALVKTRIQCDLLSAQLASRVNEESSSQLCDEILRGILSQIWKRIDSVETSEDLTKVQLQNDLLSMQFELDQLQHRYECAEAARKALNEKYSNMLEKSDETLLGTPLRCLNLNQTRRHDEKRKTPAQRKKERRQTLFTPGADNADRCSRAFKPVLFEENEDGDLQHQGNIEEDMDMIAERELLRLEIDNNRLSQIILEKEAAIKEIYDKQTSQSKQWAEEKELLMQADSSLKARIESLEAERSFLLEDVEKLKQGKKLLGLKLSSCNDEKCRLEQSIEVLRSEKFDLEDRLQVTENENERLLTELRGIPDLETNISEVQQQLRAERNKNYNLQVRNEALECECSSHLVALRNKDDELHQIISSHSKMEHEKNELTKHCDDLKRKCDQFQQNNENLKTKFDEEFNKLKRRHMDELNSKESAIDMEQNAHERTRQQFFLYRKNAEETFNRKLAELRETFSNKETRLSLDMNEKDEKIVQLQAEKEMLLRKCSTLEEVKQDASNNKERLEEAVRELALLREEKAESDRALNELVGHNNHRQKVNYLDKVRVENYNLKKRSVELEAELKRYRDALGRTKPEPTTSGVITRSRAESGK